MRFCWDKADQDYAPRRQRTHRVFACMVLLILLFTVTVHARPLVEVTSIIEHPALDATAEGIKDELAAHGYVDGESLDWAFQTAQGNVSIAAQIARKYVGDAPAVIVPIGTPSAQAVVAATRSIPVVFAAIADPVEASLVADMNEPSATNVTGVSNAVPLRDQLELIQTLVPDARKVGFIYNPGEANSVSYLKQLRQLMPEYGMELVEASAPRTVDVGTAANKLAGTVDVFYTSTDNNVVAAYEALARVARQAGIPTVAADPSIAERGVTVALGVDYYALGRQAGAMVLQVLVGTEPGSIVPQYGKELVLIVNRKAAREQGVDIPPALVARADKIID